ncbi:MAG: extracellular solute-binding protein [Sneathiella sp.]
MKIFRIRYEWILLALILALPLKSSWAEQSSLSMHGAPKYKENFTHFSYVNTNAPKGGSLHLGTVGSFNSLNPYLIKGVPAAGLGLVYQSLLSRSRDEAFSLYANIAQSFDIAPDRRWIIFKIDPRARFSDGTRLTAKDVLFSYKTLRKEGRPNHRHYYAKVDEAEILDEGRIRFSFKGEDVWELPLIMGLMPVLSSAHYAVNKFGKTTLNPAPGSGPYSIDKVHAGRRIIYKRNEKFWGRSLPQFKGRYNFDRIIYDYFRDTDVALEAFKAGTLDMRFESDPGKWTASYQSAKPDKDYQKESRTLQIPAPMKALVFNTRRALFADRQVRQALSLAFDFEWLNRNILHGAYKRTTSFFQNSPLAAMGPPRAEEISLLSPYKSELPSEIFKNEFTLPISDGSGRDRKNLKKARQLLEGAGWRLTNGSLTHKDTAQKFEFELLLQNTQEVKLLASYRQNLSRLGIKTNIRLIDTASYQNRLTDYDFDMIIATWGQSLSPGNEQSFYWSQAAADTSGSRNYPGIKLKSVDFLITRIRNARTYESLKTSTRALDRALLFGHYAIPLYYTDQQWLYRWPHIMFPKKTSYYGIGPDVGWYRSIDEGPLKTQ